MSDIPDRLPPDLSALIESNLKLADLIEPLRMILALERSPGTWERLETFMAELTAIREQMQRAADTMERALSDAEQALAQEARLESRLNQIQTDLAELKAWFGAPPPAVSPSS